MLGAVGVVLHHAGGSGLSRGRALAALLVRLVSWAGSDRGGAARGRRSDVLTVIMARCVDSMGAKVAIIARCIIPLRTRAEGWAGLVVRTRCGRELPPRQ